MQKCYSNIGCGLQKSEPKKLPEIWSVHLWDSASLILSKIFLLLWITNKPVNSTFSNWILILCPTSAEPSVCRTVTFWLICLYVSSWWKCLFTLVLSALPFYISHLFCSPVLGSCFHARLLIFFAEFNKFTSTMKWILTSSFTLEITCSVLKHFKLLSSG